MGQHSLARTLLYVCNVLYAACGAISATFGAWFFVQLYEILVLRNVNHYYLNYEIYWLQVIPWVYIVIGLSLMAAAWCGCGALASGRRGTLLLYIWLLALVTVCYVLTTALVFVFVDGQNTDKFVDDTVMDAFRNAQDNPEVRPGFDSIEIKYQCCGALNPRDYTTNSDRRFSLACCHDQVLVPEVCEIFNPKANMRHGCSKVIGMQARRVNVYMAVATVALEVAQLVGLLVAIWLYRKPQDKRLQIQESESKKVLL